MLKHFFEASRTMPLEQGSRYLAWGTGEHLSARPSNDSWRSRRAGSPPLNAGMNAPNPDERDVMDMQRLAEGQEAALNDLMERHGEKLFTDRSV